MHSPSSADLTPLPGWTATKIIGGLTQPSAGLAVDPVSHDAFVGDHTAGCATIWRVTPDGTKTAVIQSCGINVDGFALDPASGVLYVPAGAVVQRYDENGGLLGEESASVQGVGLGADGAIYAAISGTPSFIARRDPGTGVWSTWRTLQGTYDIANPRAVAVDAADRAFVDSDKGLLRVDAGATDLFGVPLITTHGINCGPLGVMAGAFTFDPNGTAPTQGTPFLVGASGVDDGLIYGAFQAADGSVYLTDLGSGAGNGSLWHITPTSTPVRRGTWGSVKTHYR
jgi:hypothetical protein